MFSKLSLFSSLFFLLTLISSCDKERTPVVVQTDLDTSLYPGNFLNYEYPEFGENTNTERNVLLEDYTGHQCSFCPGAAIVAEGLENDNPDRVFVATIHAGATANGISDFQKINSSGMYTRDFTTPEGREMASTFTDLGEFSTNPEGTINRVEESGKFFLKAAHWSDKVDEVLASELEVNLQAKSNYFEETHGVFLHIETEFLSDLQGDYNIVGYVIQKKIIDWQLIFGEGPVADYEHHNVHIGNLFGETWGRNIVSGQVSAGTKLESEFSYQIPSGLEKDDLHFLIYVYDKSSYEVKQVIKHEIE